MCISQNYFKKLFETIFSKVGPLFSFFFLKYFSKIGLLCANGVTILLKSGLFRTVFKKVFRSSKAYFCPSLPRRALTYHEHLKKTAAKVNTRNNLLAKLAGSTLGAKASTLRSSALALCYSAAEYCARCRPVHIIPTFLM